jgi:aldehyde dehydrogenase (NAD+)
LKFCIVYFFDIDADLDIAVEAVHNGLFWNEGEACASGSRIYIHSSIYKEFVRRSIERAKKRTVGHPFSNVDQGAQCGLEQFEKIMKYIEIGKKEGAKLECGGHRVGEKVK